MVNIEASRLKFGGNGKKYMAFNLMVARWLRNFAASGQSYTYITLGGTELYDVANLGWVDKLLISNVRSYEDQEVNFRLSQTVASIFSERGINVQVVKDDFFSYRRDFDGRHVFFLDLKGMFSPVQYIPLFENWFLKEVFQPGDVLFITSYMGRNPGWPKVLKRFEGDFLSLRIRTFEEKKRLYEFAHPLLILYRALKRRGFEDEFKLACFGHIRYFDSSTMGLYGITCEEGHTNLKTLVTDVPWFNSIRREWFIGGGTLARLDDAIK